MVYISGMSNEMKLIKAEAAKKKKLLFWHSFLRISTTYEQATRYRLGKLSNAELANLPQNFDHVLRTYDKFGDVWAETAESWYEENALTALQVIKGANQPKIVSTLFVGNEDKTAIALAKHIVGAWELQGRRPELLISIPVNAKKSDIHSLLEDALSDLRHDIDNGNTFKGDDIEHQLKFNIMDTKVRLSVLEKMLKLVLLRAMQPELLNWQLAQKLELSPAHVERIAQANELKQASSKQLQIADRATGDKLIINSLVGRYLRKAFLIAENAANGKFPCFVELPKVDEKNVPTTFNNNAIANGMSREYYKLNGRRPLKTEYRTEWSYQSSDDDWWEESFWNSEKPSKREAEIDLGDETDEPNDLWSGGSDEVNGDWQQ